MVHAAVHLPWGVLYLEIGWVVSCGQGLIIMGPPLLQWRRHARCKMVSFRLSKQATDVFWLKVIIKWLYRRFKVLLKPPSAFNSCYEIFNIGSQWDANSLSNKSFVRRIGHQIGSLTFGILSLSPTLYLLIRVFLQGYRFYLVRMLLGVLLWEKASISDVRVLISLPFSKRKKKKSCGHWVEFSIL